MGAPFFEFVIGCLFDPSALLHCAKQNASARTCQNRLLTLVDSKAMSLKVTVSSKILKLCLLAPIIPKLTKDQDWDTSHKMPSYRRHTDCFPPAIMDIEASGFGRESYPIEIGYIESDQTRFCSLILPESDWTHWCNEAEQLHGIQRDDLRSSGLHAKEMTQVLNRNLQGNILYCDGWVQDHNWLLRLYNAVSQSPSFRLSPIEMIMNEDQINIWDETKERLIQQSNQIRHRASHDAYLIQKTWIETFKFTRYR